MQVPARPAAYPHHAHPRVKLGDMAAIELNAVVKTFGHVRALDGLDLEVAPSEVHGFLGRAITLLVSA